MTRTCDARFRKPAKHPENLQNGAHACVNLADRAALLAEIDDLAGGLERLRRAVLGSDERAVG